MDRYSIDYSKYDASNAKRPKEHQVAAWTFAIDGRPAKIFGSFASACAQAKLYARLSDDATGVIGLEGAARCGRLYRDRPL